MFCESIFTDSFLGVLDQFKKLTTLKDKKVVLFGATGVGKTTLLYKIRLGEVVPTIPTMGFNVESIKFKRTNLTIWDVGGQEKIIPLWRHYIQGVRCVLFMINASRKDEFGYYVKLLMNVIDDYRNLNNQEKEQNIKILILGNVFEKNNIQIDALDFAEEVKAKTKFLGKIEGIELSLLDENMEKITSSICGFFK